MVALSEQPKSTTRFKKGDVVNIDDIRTADLAFDATARTATAILPEGTTLVAADFQMLADELPAILPGRPTVEVNIDHDTGRFELVITRSSRYSTNTWDKWTNQVREALAGDNQPMGEPNVNSTAAPMPATYTGSPSYLDEAPVTSVVASAPVYPGPGAAPTGSRRTVKLTFGLLRLDLDVDVTDGLGGLLGGLFGGNR